MSIYEPGVADLPNLAVDMVVRARYPVHEIPLYPGEPEIPGPLHYDVCYVQVTSIEEEYVQGRLLDRNFTWRENIILNIPRNLIESIVRMAVKIS